MRTVWTFHSAGALVFGRGAVGELGDFARRMNARRALIVTDPILVKAGLADAVSKPLGDAGLAVDTFDGGEPEPSMRAAEACVARARTFGPDVLVGLGG